MNRKAHLLTNLKLVCINIVGTVVNKSAIALFDSYLLPIYATSLMVFFADLLPYVFHN